MSTKYITIYLWLSIFFLMTNCGKSNFKLELPDDYSGWGFVREDTSLKDNSILQEGRVFYVSSDLFVPNSKLDFFKGSKELTQNEIPFYRISYHPSIADRSKKEYRIENSVKVIEFYVTENQSENFKERSVELKYIEDASKIVDSLITNGFLK